MARKMNRDFTKFSATFATRWKSSMPFPSIPVSSYEKVLKDKKSEVTQFGLPVYELKICPQSFFTLQINPDEKNCSLLFLQYPGIIGDCNKETVADISEREKPSGDSPENTRRIKSRQRELRKMQHHKI